MAAIIKHHSLSKVLNRVKDILDTSVSNKRFWLKVEIASVDFHRSGHIYLHLVENFQGKILAKCKGLIFASAALEISCKLGGDFKNILKQGSEILCFVRIRFDVIYGVDIVINNIDMDYAIGQLENKRIQTLKKLKEEGLIDLNKQIEVPMVLSKIAIIASKNTSGYQDFITNLENNQHGYKYNLKVYSSSVQGNIAENELLNRLIEINERKYDCVVIIRGGGSKLDLDVFNSYSLCEQVSRMRSVVFTGIGHETDQTVIDLVANKAFKTPTEVSNWIVSRTYEAELSVKTSYHLINEMFQRILDNRTNYLRINTEGIVNFSNRKSSLKRGSLHTLMNRILYLVNSDLNNQNKYLALLLKDEKQYQGKIISKQEDLIRKKLEILILLISKTLINERAHLTEAMITAASNNPKSILAKGFTIPRVNGNIYKGEELSKNTIIKLEFQNSVIITKYIKKEKRWKINPFQN